MKIRFTKKDVIKWSACIVCVCCVAFFGVYFYKNAQRVIPPNPISDEIQQLSVDGQGRISESLAEKINEESSKIDSENQDENGNNSENENDSTDENSGNSNDNSGAGSTSNTTYSTNTNGVDADSSSSESDKKQNGGINAEVKDDGKSDTAYFKTSIKDGETVFEKTYQFTVTQLQKELKLRSQRILVNGNEVLQFSGKCTLNEGENTIRVQCTYTDTENSVKRAYKDYTVYCYSENIGFSTDLSDRTVNDSRLDFFAKAFYDEKDIDIEVKLNGEIISGNGEYSVTLSKGENIVAFYSEYNGKSSEKSYVINFEKPQEFGIYTDLYDMTVNNENFSFTAKITGASESGKLTVAVNGKSVTGENGIYNVNLKSGENSIRLRAKDGENTTENVYKITLVPKADETTMPSITSTNLIDEMTVRGSGLTVSLTARNYQGNRIYADKIEIYVNNLVSNYQWQNSTETGYYLSLQGGQNTVSIRITDAEGRYRDYFYTINCQQASQGEEIGKINLSFDASVLGFSSLGESMEIPFCEGESAMDTIKKYLELNGFSYNVSGTADTGYYLAGIAKFGAFQGGQIPEQLESYLSRDGIGKTGNSSSDSLSEFDYTQGSGWVISVNGKVTSYGISQTHFMDGDTVRLTFTLCYGREISGAENAYDVVW